LDKIFIHVLEVSTKHSTNIFHRRESKPPPKLILEEIEVNANTSNVDEEKLKNFFEELKKPRKPKRR
jgi:hypothetical protein